MKCISALSTARNTEAALEEVVGRATEELAGEPADLALVFLSMQHAEGLERIASELRRRGLGKHVLGCTGESIVGEDREVEGLAALSLWALRAPGVSLRPHRVTFRNGGFSDASVDSKSALLLLGDPFSFPADQFLKHTNEKTPSLRVLGGMASGGEVPGENRLALDDQVYEDGAVAIEVGGALTIRTVVSQGCRPIGRPMIVTRAERNLIRELGRRPALEMLREVFETLSESDQDLVRQGLHIGRVINEYQESFDRGDFLVRNVIGADDSGAMAITDSVRVGQTVQFHVRDAETADEDLRGLLQNAKQTQPDTPVGGALLFSCNGRGTRLFPAPNHDVQLIREVFGPIPVAGFFAMGELGPIGGQNFLHGYTASIALFEEARVISD